MVLGAQSQCTVRQPCREPWIALSWEWCGCISTAPSCLPSFWLHQLLPDTAGLALLVDCCGTRGRVLTLGIVWTSQWDQRWLRHSALGFTGCCRRAPAMWISSPDGSCLRLRCLERGSYLSVVNQGCFRPQRTVCLASSCCSLRRRLGYLAMCSFSKGLRQ